MLLLFAAVGRGAAVGVFLFDVQAYEVLGDSEKRRYYDTYGHEGVASAEQQQSAGGAGAYEDHWVSSDKE